MHCFQSTHVIFFVQRDFTDFVLCCVLLREGFGVDSGLLGGLLSGRGKSQDTWHKDSVRTPPPWGTGLCGVGCVGLFEPPYPGGGGSGKGDFVIDRL